MCFHCHHKTYWNYHNKDHTESALSVVSKKINLEQTKQRGDSGVALKTYNIFLFFDGFIEKF